MSTVAFTAQSLDQRTAELRAIRCAGDRRALVGAALIALQIPLAAVLLVRWAAARTSRGRKTYFIVQIWSAPLALGNYVVLAG